MTWKPIKRDLYNNSFVHNKFPLWTCPMCDTGHLGMDKESVRIIESVDSIKSRSHEDWDPFWIRGSFSGVLKCVNSDCEESIQIIGTMSGSIVERIEEDEDGFGYVVSNPNVSQEDLLPLAFFPTLKIFKIHSDVPAAIATAIIETFKLYWIDTEACCNKIRTVVELILDEQNVDKTGFSKKKKEIINLILNDRIDLFKNKKPEEAEFMLAIKWIGNEGSHNINTLTKNDALDAYDMLDYVTTKLYVKDSENPIKDLREKKNVINETKKPYSHKIKKEIRESSSHEMGNVVDFIEEI